MSYITKGYRTNKDIFRIPTKPQPHKKDCDCFACELSNLAMLKASGAKRKVVVKPAGMSLRLPAWRITAGFYKP